MLGDFLQVRQASIQPSNVGFRMSLLCYLAYGIGWLNGDDVMPLFRKPGSISAAAGSHIKYLPR